MNPNTNHFAPHHGLGYNPTSLVSQKVEENGNPKVAKGAPSITNSTSETLKE